MTHSLPTWALLWSYNVMVKAPAKQKIDPTRCDFVKKDGNQCSRKCGWGTDHQFGRCKTHGGNSPTHKRAAARQQIVAMALSASTDSESVLQGSIDRAWGEVLWLQEKLAEYDSTNEDGVSEILFYQKLYGEWLDRASKTAKLALDAGVEERKVRVEEAKGQLLAAVIRTILEGLGLTPAQQAKAPQLVRGALLALEA